jgi:uncharacterized protein
MFISILLSLIAMGIWWRVRLGAALEDFAHARLWRALATLFLLAMIFCPLISAELGHVFYPPVAAAGFLFHLLIAPLLVVVLILLELVARARRWKGTDADINPGRRKFLTAVAGLAPPLATVGLTGISQEQLGKFRVRDLDVELADWPSALDGFTIAFVADVHHGPFCTQAMLDDIVRRTNAIHNGGPADLVVLGGDLINTSLNDLPAALDMATALRGRLGTVACMGNHDVMDNAGKFVTEVERRGVPLLIDDAMTFTASGGARFQVLGVNWQLGQTALNWSVGQTAAKRDPALFPICLAHHPHAWDEAARLGLPLVLSGHTHGGQIMLTDKIGAGPLRFRYWNGVHKRNGSTLVISNGVGNWFPLRLNAPAEILKLTLTRSPTIAAGSVPPPPAMSRAPQDTA